MQLGERVPDFALPNEDGELVKLSELLGHGPVVVFFYPRDETAGCTAEACSFRDAHEEFARAGARIVGISSDDPKSHRHFIDKHRLGYTLLADTNGHVRALFGVPRQLLGIAEGRVTFILDKDGVVRHRYDSLVRVHRHVQEALASVQQLAAS